MKKTIFALLLAGLLPLASIAQDSTQFIKASWNELLTKAKKAKKPIFVDTYFEGCHACKDMEVRVFPSKDVKQYMLDNFVNTGFDVFKEEFGNDLCARYLLHGFPTYLIISPEGKLVNVGIGYSDANVFLQFLNESVAKYKAGKFHNGFSTTIVKEGPQWYQQFYSKSREFPKDSVLQDFLAKQKDKKAEMTVKAMALCRNLPADYRTYYLANRQSYNDLFGSDVNYSILSRMMNNDLKELPAKYDEAAFTAFINKHEKEYAAGGDWDKVKMEFAMSYMVRNNKDVKAFIAFAIANHDKNDNNARMLPFYGYEGLKDPAVEEQYLTWARSLVNEGSSLELLQAVGHRSIEKHPEDAKKYLTWALAKAEVMSMTDVANSLREKLKKI
ncbi:MAG: thioredoxin family protein [Chitinophaga sp.]|uniref:thioredoxin family protein n=1 Tax=Chitinophaga sp. TaxID=1869181 RepID=UPI0025BEC8F5|nr:thioredoxin family protein [Chitinophaga sp.]MBV8255477.1 thioredoxin family protein [Chitinophaga sp.]